MTTISRRLLGMMSFFIPLSILAATAQAQDKPKPEVKWSEAKPLVEAYVEKLSAATKEATGQGFTPQQKFELVGTIMADMEAQNIYAFVDP
jgi:hypothetical protein